MKLYSGASGTRTARAARAVLFCGVLVAAAACGGDDEAVSPAASIPLEVQACDRPADDAPQQRCLGQIAEFLESKTLAAADGDTVTHSDFDAALDALDINAVAEAVGTNWSFSRDPVSLDFDAAQVATSPIKTTWSVGGVRVELWTCFDGTLVTVSQDACIEA